MREHEDFLIAAILEEGVLDRAAVQSAVREGAASGQTPSESLVSRGLLSAREVALVRASIAEVPFVDAEAYEVDIRNCERLPRGVAESLCAFPLFDLGEVVTVGMADPLDLRAVDQLRSVIRGDVEPVLCEAEPLRRLIERAYALTGRGEVMAGSPGGASGAGSGAGSAGGALSSAAALTTGKEPIVAAVNQILAQAVERGASDVHINPDEHALHLRFRIDGHLQAQQGPPLSAHGGIVQRIKVMAGLDLTQTRRPQDGKFRHAHGDRQVDVRVSILPTVSGENVVMRLLSSAAQIKGFAELGLLPADVRAVEGLLGHPNGMVLVTGPTGSGKTTTLYTALKKLNTPDVNVMTIEDPVEIRVPMIRQVQANAEIGLTFAGALRSMLRQDPDVVLVGEIRDEETAKIAVQAALTGHLVLSSLHTNDACGAIPRLIDLGCPGFAINAALLGAIAQRLVRRVCGDCAAEDHPDPMLLARFGVTRETSGGSASRFVRGAGCPRCVGTGYKGRLGVYEVMAMTPAVQRAVETGESAGRLRRVAIDEGMTPLWADGLAKARVSLTTLEEVVRVAAVQAADAEGAMTETGAVPRRAAA
ncbi:MAG: type II/IV secretion system protein [Phycisphaerae bacterium]|nr:type II/IV secretion system protein [Phycisphaerae bacterium]